MSPVLEIFLLTLFSTHTLLLVLFKHWQRLLSLSFTTCQSSRCDCFYTTMFFSNCPNCRCGWKDHHVSEHPIISPNISCSWLAIETKSHSRYYIGYQEFKSYSKGCLGKEQEVSVRRKHGIETAYTCHLPLIVLDQGTKCRNSKQLQSMICIFFFLRSSVSALPQIYVKFN